jgi:hypothetical protein
MTATSPSGYLFLVCGGRAVPTPPLGAGGGSTGTNPATPSHPVGATSRSNTATVPRAPVHATTAAAHSPPPLVPVTAAGSSQLTFTGMDVGPPLLLGLLLTGLGPAMMAGSGPRRSRRGQLVPVIPPKSSS